MHAFEIQEISVLQQGELPGIPSQLPVHTCLTLPSMQSRLAPLLS